MKMFLAVLATISVALVAEGTLEPGLRAKFDMGTDPAAGEQYFYKLPLTIDAAKEDGWRQTRRPSGPMPELMMFCPSGKLVCALYDDNNHVAGLQIAISKHDFTNNVFDWEKRGFSTWNTSVNGQCTSLFAIQQYFVSEEYLKKSKQERLQAYDPTRLLQENAIWFTGTDGKLWKVYSNEEDIIEEKVFTKQGCLPWMGQHYYYNASSTVPCDEENMYPWFPMFMNGELVASGFLTFGNLPVPATGRDWFERPDAEIVKMIVPNGSECLYDLSASPGVLTLHIYYTSTPWLITC